METSKVLLVALAALSLITVCVVETRKVEDDDNPVEKRQTLTRVLVLLKKLESRVARLETKRIRFFRGRDGRDGMPGLPGKCLTCKDGRNGRNGASGQRGPPGVRGRPGSNGGQGSRGPKGDRGPGGVAYVRWGRTTCPRGASLVYKGRMGGEYYTHTGGGTNYVCLPENPRYVRYTNGHQLAGYMYGAEYERGKNNPLTKSNLLHHDAPCAVCHVQTRSAEIMIPATYACPSGWRREYWGYLMSERYNHAHPSEYICVDKDAEYIAGSSRGNHGVLLYPVEGRCGSLPCRPYVDGRELTCAVCTK